MKFNIQDMLGQAQKMQQEMERLKSEISTKTVTGESGGGMITVTATGDNKIISIKIAKELIDPAETEMLEDLTVAAVNNALKKAQALMQEEMQKITGMLPNIPGFNFNF